MHTYEQLMYLVKAQSWASLNTNNLIAQYCLFKSVKPCCGWHWLKTILYLPQMIKPNWHQPTTTNPLRVKSEWYGNYSTVQQPGKTAGSSQRSAIAPTSATGKVAWLVLFDGSPEKLDVFLCELYLNFEDDPSYLKADHMWKMQWVKNCPNVKDEISRMFGFWNVGTYGTWLQLMYPVGLAVHP